MRWCASVLVLLSCMLVGAVAARAGNTFPGTTITGINTNFSGSNVGATGETGEPLTVGGGTLNTMWYTWQAPGNGTVTFETCGTAAQTSFDTTLAAYTGTPVGSLTVAAPVNDDTTGCAAAGGANLGSRITWNVTQGVDYKIQVDGYASNTGTFRLTYRFTGFTITKTPSVATIAAPGTITYTISVANAGYIALTGATITDSLNLGGSARTLTSGPTLTSGDLTPTGSLGTTETWVYTATYAVPQSDIDLGGTYSNTATFDTTQTIAYTSAAATTAIIQSPAFTNVKAQTAGPNPITDLGQTVTYTITIDNTGNVTLTTPAVVSDVLQMGGNARTLTTGPTYVSGDADADGNIDVTEVWTYTATYVSTQADMDTNGNLTNVLTYDTAQTAALASNTATTTVTHAPTLSLNKTWSFASPGHDADGDGFADVGDIITYNYAVTNTGKVTINSVSIGDVHLGAGSLSAITPASVASLAPGASTNFTATYVTVQGDIDNQ